MTSAADTDTPQVTVEEITELITEFEKYRDRLTSETLDAAKKAKMSKKETMAKLEPELAKIDAALTQLHAQLAAIAPEATTE